jgi:hypothetical protein
MAVNPETDDRVAEAYDRLGSVPEFSEVADAMARRDWPATEEALSALPADQESYALELLADEDGVETFLEDSVAAHPASARARTALAARWIVLGWSARGHALASETSGDQFAAFREWLIRAEQLLTSVCADDPAYAPVWAARILTARGLEVGQSEAIRRYRQVDSLFPHHFPAQRDTLIYLSPRWHGDNRTAHAFALRALEEAPDGSDSGSLIAFYHLERWMEAGRGEAGAAILAQPAVLDEIRDAASRSVLHPSHVPSPLGIQAHSAFALALWLAGARAEAAVHLRALGGRASAFPWDHAIAGPDALRIVADEVFGPQDAAA